MPIVQINPEAMIRQDNAPYTALLKKAGFTVQYPRNTQLARGVLTVEETVAELQHAAAVIATQEHYDEQTLSQLPNLRVIARAGVGYDHVDISAATARNIVVTITPTANHEAVAELTLALLFAVVKRIPWQDRQVREGHWPRKPLGAVRGKTLGVLGLGRIGRSVVVRAKALGVKVLACESAPQQEFVHEHQIDLVDWETLLSRSDFLSLHCPLNDETRGLINQRTLESMKPGAVLINAARGGLVVEEDLVAALRSGHLSGAGLDVFEQEPPSPDNPLFQLENVVATSHIAGADDVSLDNMGLEAAACIVQLYRGQWPNGCVVNEELRGRWKF